MRTDLAKLLEDIADAASRVKCYTAGKTLQDYLASSQLRDAVQWNFTVIGEAISQLRNKDPGMVERIHEWQRIIAFRNQLIHGYGVIKNEITWDIVQTKLPILMDDIAALLGSPR